MSPLAKVFVFVNLVLSLCFFASSATLFATRVNWRQKAVDYKKESLDLLREVEQKYQAQGRRLLEQDKQITRLNTDLNSLTSERNKLQTDLVAARGELDKANLRNETEVAEKKELTSRLKGLEEKTGSLEQLLDANRKDADAAKAAKEVADNERNRFLVDLDKVNGEHSNTLIALKELQDKAESMNFQLEAIRKRIPDLELLEFPPPIDAVVQAVKDSHVVLSVGSDNSRVEEGFRFTVYRGDRFVGKVQVIKVYSELAGARILFTSDNELIQVGDKAATQL